jgi:hypothetical protein
MTKPVSAKAAEAVRRPYPASRPSIQQGMTFSRAVWRGEELGLSGSSRTRLVLRQAPALASSASAQASCTPGHHVAHDALPGYPVQVGDHRRQPDRRNRYSVVLSGGQSSSSLAFSAA